MAAYNEWTHYPSGVSECEVRHENGKCGTVTFDTADYDRLKDVRLRLMTEPSGRTYCVARTNSAGQTLIHRWLLGVTDSRVVHHVNDDPLDNRRCNLSVTTQSENIRARRAWGESGRKCVYRNKRDGSYYVVVTAYGYDDPDEAQAVADALMDARSAFPRPARMAV